MTANEALSLEEKREKALRELGDKWVLHPRHAPSRKSASALEMQREMWRRQQGVGPTYSDLRAEARMIGYYEKRNQEDLK